MPSHDRSPAIAVRDLTKTYPGEVKALDGVSFSVPTGTIFGLLGPNGAGKSSTIKILTTLTRPDSGQARVAGVDVLSDPGKTRRLIGVVAQGSGLDPNATGRENLSLQGRVHGMGGPNLRSRIGELLDRFGLSEAADRLAKTYSGGMQRRLDIALGMVHSPQVLFLDEPTTGLDPEVRAEMWDMITELVSRDGITILLTTHYLDEADRLADQLVIVDEGRVVAEGTPERLKGDLKGDAIQVELINGSPEPEVRAALTGLPGLGGVTMEGRVVHARVPVGASAVPSVLSALESARIPVASVTVARPSLDDVYLRHTGRSFAAVNEEGTR